MEEDDAGRRRGVLKVLVARGTNLAVRDFTSSDPYVIVRLAAMSAKTKVINSCLNPFWNEEMSFSIEEPTGVIKFEVFDWDRFKYDDKMGHAFLELQPVAAAAKLRRALRLTTEETKLRKVAASVDNCLMCDSFVTYADGEIKLDAKLRLRDVESGELFVTVKWIEADAK
uniref:C2 domain-containing protein n=1 Tax=Leersia perrieri TaxID=77586 RepID=A0A0D9XBN2_9ORYZ